MSKSLKIESEIFDLHKFFVVAKNKLFKPFKPVKPPSPYLFVILYLIIYIKP